MVLTTLAALVAGCVTHRDAETLQLSSGRTIRVVQRYMIDSTFTFHYCASYDFSHLDSVHLDTLRAEVKEVWHDIQQQADQSAAVEATIWANTCRRRLVWDSWRPYVLLDEETSFRFRRHATGEWSFAGGP